jgi:predicted enzyme related to lactoylglutathione lyase
VEELGGTKMIEPFAFPMGRIGIVADPHGAAFAFYAGQLDP